MGYKKSTLHIKVVGHGFDRDREFVELAERLYLSYYDDLNVVWVSRHEAEVSFSLPDAAISEPIEYMEMITHQMLQAIPAPRIDTTVRVWMENRRLQCDMEKDCSHPVTHIDEKGFVYCSSHGDLRKASMRCRKLKPTEVLQLENAKPLRAY